MLCILLRVDHFKYSFTMIHQELGGYTIFKSIYIILSIIIFVLQILWHHGITWLCSDQTTANQSQSCSVRESPRVSRSSDDQSPSSARGSPRVRSSTGVVWKTPDPVWEDAGGSQKADSVSEPGAQEPGSSSGCVVVGTTCRSRLPTENRCGCRFHEREAERLCVLVWSCKFESYSLENVLVLYWYMSVGGNGASSESVIR